MINDIPFIDLTPLLPIEEGEMKLALNNLGNMVNDEAKKAFDSHYHISGKARSLFPSLSPKTQDDSFLYVQSFIEMESDENYFTQRKNYASYLLLFTLEGEGELKYENRTYILKPGDGFLIDCRKEQSYKTVGKKWKHYDLHFDGKESELIYQEFEKSRSLVFHLIQEEYLSRLNSLLEEIISPSSHRAYFISTKINRLLAYCLKNDVKENNIPEIYTKISRYLQTHHTENISLDDLSKMFNLSKYHLSREFKSHFNYAPKEYLIKLRLSHACYLLINSELTVEKIGILSGIPNLTNFIRLFEKYYHLTPSVYRQKALDNTD